MCKGPKQYQTRTCPLGGTGFLVSCNPRGTRFTVSLNRKVESRDFNLGLEILEMKILKAPGWLVCF